MLENDEEGYQLWKAMGLPDDKIVRCGMEDNFWSMGDGEGPCGPCTEIFWDTQDKSLDDPWLEIWNLVFMENYRTADGQITKLPSPCIDTGMGLERVASVLQVMMMMVVWLVIYRLTNTFHNREKQTTFKWINLNI